MTVAIGIAYDKKTDLLTDAKTGLLNVWESYVAQKYGELGTAVVVQPSVVKEFKSYEKEHFVLIKAKSGKPITHYVGAGWSKSPQFKTKQDWLDYLNKEIPTLKF